MKENMGLADKIIRILVAVIIATLYSMHLSLPQTGQISPQEKGME